METKNVRLTAYITYAERTKLRIMAAERGITVTALVRELLKKGLEK